MRVIAKVMDVPGIITLGIRSSADRHFSENTSTDPAKHKHSASIRRRHIALPLNFPRTQHLASEIRLRIPYPISTYQIPIDTRVGYYELFLIAAMYFTPPPIPGRSPCSHKPGESLLLFLNLSFFMIQPTLQIQLCH